ncbi:MAG: hypothetical protein NTZ61_00765, partial [Proteobacteria bacterium]|nr:hypothetical protein [Pseudomonadota bacterium]
MTVQQPRFGLTKLALGEPGFIELSETEFESLRDAREAVFDVLGLEEKLDLLVENYAEFEQELLEVALRHSLSFVLEWSSAMSQLQTINRRLANLLATARLYIHQTQRGLVALFGRESTELLGFRTALEEEANKHLGHRAMHALRNHIQHSNLPIHELVYDSGWKDEKEGRFLVYVTVPKIRVAHLHADRDLKSIAEELQGLGDRIDVRPLVRQHVQSLMTVHSRVRELVAKHEAQWLSRV